MMSDRILAILARTEATSASLARELGCHQPSACRVLSWLLDEGRIRVVRVERPKGAARRVFGAISRNTV